MLSPLFEVIMEFKVGDYILYRGYGRIGRILSIRKDRFEYKVISCRTIGETRTSTQNMSDYTKVNYMNTPLWKVLNE